MERQKYQTNLNFTTILYHLRRTFVVKYSSSKPNLNVCETPGDPGGSRSAPVLLSEVAVAVFDGRDGEDILQWKLKGAATIVGNILRVAAGLDNK